MPEVSQINSKKGLVRFSMEDLADLNLLRYVRTSFKGIGKKGLITDGPFETAAAHYYKEKYPQAEIFIAEKCLLNHDNSVDVILRVAKEVSSEMYNQNSNSLVLRKQEKSRG
jgi:hypothetical protein